MSKDNKKNEKTFIYFTLSKMPQMEPFTIDPTFDSTEFDQMAHDSGLSEIPQEEIAKRAEAIIDFSDDDNEDEGLKNLSLDRAFAAHGEQGVVGGSAGGGADDIEMAAGDEEEEPDVRDEGVEEGAKDTPALAPPDEGDVSAGDINLVLTGNITQVEKPVVGMRLSNTEAAALRELRKNNPAVTHNEMSYFLMGYRLKENHNLKDLEISARAIRQNVEVLGSIVRNFKHVAYTTSGDTIASVVDISEKTPVPTVKKMTGLEKIPVTSVGASVKRTPSIQGDPRPGKTIKAKDKGKSPALPPVKVTIDTLLLTANIQPEQVYAMGISVELLEQLLDVYIKQLRSGDHSFLNDMGYYVNYMNSLIESALAHVSKK